MDTRYTFWDNTTHYKTESVYFLGLINSATKKKLRQPPTLNRILTEELPFPAEGLRHFWEPPAEPNAPRRQNVGCRVGFRVQGVLGLGLRVLACTVCKVSGPGSYCWGVALAV